MAKLFDVFIESLRELLGNFCLTACTLAAQAFSPIPGTVHSGLAIGQTG